MRVVLLAALVVGFAGCDQVFGLERPGDGSGPALIASSFTSAPDTLTLTFPLTIPDEQDRFLIVAAEIGWFGTPAPTVISVSYNGTPLTLLFAVSGVTGARSEQWQLLAPPSGAHDVVVTLTAQATSFHASALAFANVNQDTPVRASTGLNDVASAGTLPVSSAPGDLVESTVGHGSAIRGPAGDQTLVYLDNVNDGTTLNNAAASTAPGRAGTVSMTWTFASEDHTQIIAASLQP